MIAADRAAILHAITQLTRIQPQLTEAEQPVHDAIQALHDELDQEDTC